MRPCTPHNENPSSWKHLKFQSINQDLCGAQLLNHQFFNNNFFTWCNTFFYNEGVSRMFLINPEFVEILLVEPHRSLSTSKSFLRPKNLKPQRRCTTINIRNLFEGLLLLQLFTFCSVATAFRSFNDNRPCQNAKVFKQIIDNSTDQCTMWSDEVIPEICSAGTQSRIRILKHVFLFSELQPLSIFEMFSIGTDNPESWPLQKGYMGTDCIAGSINRCTACFRKISGTLKKLNEAFQSFDITLSRFDCLPAVDTASATRPFSPNATCINCKIWYRRWLLVQSLQIWQKAPCINWCYYTQLACPHLAPAKLWDYAGHPSFQCRDMDIDSWRHECDCIHPCDVRGIVAPGILGDAPSVQHDFFPAQIHCTTRKKECHQRFKKMKNKRNEPTKTVFLSILSLSPRRFAFVPNVFLVSVILYFLRNFM